MLFDDAIPVGKITKCRSPKGDVQMYCTNDVATSGRSKFLILEIDGLKVPFHVEDFHEKGSGTLTVHFTEIRSDAEAHKILGAQVFYPKCRGAQDNADESTAIDSLTGFRLIDTKEGTIGTINSVDDSSENILLYITPQDAKTPQDDIIIPFNRDFMVDFDEEQRTLTMNLPEGIITLND